MRSPLVGSLFSGAGGFDIGFERAGFEVAWQVEIDRDCVSVLERHWPTVRRYGDVQAVDPAALAPVDVVIFGSPCQDFSVAGKRAGLDGERSGLFGEAIRIIRGLRPAPSFCVWENVPGALSSARGRDFGAVIDALAEAGALDVAWRVLDARWFGVPQRRRRIFVVADFGAERSASVLFESEVGSGDSAASRAAGEGAPGDAEGGAGDAGNPDIAGTLYAKYGKTHGTGNDDMQRGFGLLRIVDEPVAAEGGNRTSGPIEVATAVNAHGGPHGRQDFESETFIVANSVTASAGHHGHSSPRGDGSDNLIPVAIRIGQQGANGHGFADDEAHALDSGGPVQAVAFQESQSGMRDGDTFATLDSNYGSRRHNGVAVAISENQRAEVRETPYARQLTNGGGKAGQGYPAVREGMAVRRLTPREAERLQGWPDDHTRWRADGQEISDGPRYRMVGNGVAAPVATFIAARILAALTKVAV